MSKITSIKVEEVEVKQEPTHEILSVSLTLPKPFVSENRFQCEKCNRGFKTAKTFNTHKCFICTICKKSFCSSQALQRHIEAIHENVQRYQCDACEYNGKNRQHFVLHYKEKHSKDDPKFECDICGSKFRCKRNLMLHLTAIHPPKVLCKICNTFVIQMQLKNHITTVHYHEGIKCKFCDKTFKTKQGLRVHMKVHTQNHKCEKCGKILVTDTKYKDHLKLHDNPKTFQCEICHVNFNGSTTLKKHKRTFKNNSCKLRFKYACKEEGCDFAASKQKDLREHFRVTHGKDCRYCSQNVSLKFHFERLHGI